MLQASTANLTSIPNYADRQRHGEPIATGFVESAVNQVVSKRLVKRQQMEATSEGWSEGMNVIGNVLNLDYSSSGCESRPAKA